MLAAMTRPPLQRCWILAVTLIAAAACSDQGAVKDDPKRAPAVKAPSTVVSHADAPQALPPGHPPIDAAQAPAGQLPPVPAGADTGAAGLAWDTPRGWVSETPSSPMRRAQYRVPGKAGDGECAVFYFGPGQGGDPMSNARRWADQFTTPDGKPATNALKTSDIDVSGFKVLIVEVAGTYKGGMTMTAAPTVPQPGYRLLGAVAEGPDANWFFKLTGPDETIQAQRGAFESMVRSLRHGAS